jgi:hypothetical protein
MYIDAITVNRSAIALIRPDFVRLNLMKTMATNNNIAKARNIQVFERAI